MPLPSLKPKQLFIIDGLGALLSAFLLGVILVRFEYFFGIPKEALYILAIPPLTFMIFDLFSYYAASQKDHLLLKIIAFANLSYFLLSLGLAAYHHEIIRTWGWVYLGLEVLIVVPLALIELKAAKVQLK